MKHIYTALLAGSIAATGVSGQTILTTGFDDLSSMTSNGWMQVNKSNPLGTTEWAQGTGNDVGVATGHSGDATSYITDTYTATDAVNTGTISDWVISPAVNLQNGDSIAFWTISYNSATYPDRVECRISTNGGSDVGTAATDVGDFTTLVFSINPDLNATDYPDVAVSADTWTRFGGIVAGLSGSTSCRIAIRYFIEDGGGAGSHGSTVGIDDLTAFTPTASGIHENTLTNVTLAPNPTLDRVTIAGANGTTGTYDLTVFNVAGDRVAAERFNNSMVMDLSGYNAGVYFMEVLDIRSGKSSRQRLVKL